MKKLMMSVLCGTMLVLCPMNCPIEAKAPEDASVQPMSDIIEWVYQNFDGVLYKRLYNFTTQEWIGRWIRA